MKFYVWIYVDILKNRSSFAVSASRYQVTVSEFDSGLGKCLSNIHHFGIAKTSTRIAWKVNNDGPELRSPGHMLYSTPGPMTKKTVLCTSGQDLK